MSEQTSNENSEIFTKPGFDLEEAINSASDPLVEIAGPTSRGYELLGGKTLQALKDEGKKIYITTIPPEKLEYDPEWEKPDADEHQKALLEIWKGIQEWHETKKPHINVFIDATKTAFKNESIGGVFSALLPRNIFQEVEPEVYRSLVPGGFWAIERMSNDELKQAQKIGFEVGYKSDVSRVHPFLWTNF